MKITEYYEFMREKRLGQLQLEHSERLKREAEEMIEERQKRLVEFKREREKLGEGADFVLSMEVYI